MAIEDINKTQHHAGEFDNTPELPMDKETFSSHEYEKEIYGGQGMDDQFPTKATKENKKLPSSMIYIMVFSFYGLKSILSMYCTQFMGYNKSTAVTVIHTFNFAAYAFPLLGAYLADARLGKFRTILYFSIIYCIGGIFLSVSAVPGVTGDGPGNRSPWGLITGLVLIALGTGGIKPVVSAFCGDQLGPDQKTLLQLVFQIFYWCINFGSFFSTILTPLLRKYVGYWLAFGVPAILLLFATLVFILGYKKYVKRPTTGSILLDSCRIVGTGIAEKFRSRRAGYDDRYYNSHWLDRAKIRHDPKLVDSVRAALKVILVFVPMPFFWCLYDQTSSRWTQTAETMDLSIGSVKLEADQIQAINPLLIMILVPVFEYCLYRPLKKRNINFHPLLRITIGMWLSIAAFLLAMFIEMRIDKEPVGTVSVFLQLPQYVLLTCAEILISITSLEFAYSQAPATMKSIIMSFYLLSVSLGNVIVVVVVDGVSITPQWKEYLVFSCIMAVFTVVFMVIAWRYKPVDPSIYEFEEPKDENETELELSEKPSKALPPHLRESQTPLNQNIPLDMSIDKTN
ncbi:Peptide transporter PepT1 [Heterostelium album PN500]|uniref:Peptide transporter PepT1 n=1 Tax=Heterostelium pallidum (strain ATCC 26659 / Pp 5 / PN500) TaxID=670386 RepID=D3BCZ6_HETP5|nr:Peptide transporter PepT1 [Heterostelium album PN500]EFA80788.1 Peptide transporter PepT1 [Heterostelium album PN500]|eukprot:XP_020432907.1 Peptide transporter PepT1 [Heterostelium album PN500]